MEKSALEKMFSNFSSYKVLIIGDVMLDSYMWGKVKRISREAPVPIVSIAKRENRLGGAANVALNIRAMGATAILASIIGDDEKGKILLNLLDKRNLSKEGILTSPSRPTTVKHRVISQGQHLLRVDEETNKPIPEEIEKEFIIRIKQIAQNKKIDAIIFEDYDKGIITPKVISEIVDYANQNNIPTLVDPKKRNFLNYHGVTLFKPNFKELLEGLKIEAQKDNLQELLSAARKLQDKMNIKNVLITLSEAGIFICNKENHLQIPAQVRDISDVSGAGDTVISVATLCMIAKMDLSKIAAISNIAGGLVCEKVGVVPINMEHLLKETVEYFK